jgi:Ca2+-binding RTX toxin-like protein
MLAPASFAGTTINQTVAKSGTVVTWTGGALNTGTDQNSDVTSMTEPVTGSVTISTTSGTLTIISSTDADADCDYDNAEQTSVTCVNTDRVVGNAGSGDDTVDAGGLNTIPVSTLSGGDGNDTLSGGAANDRIKGDDNDDTVNGGPGDDDLKGGTGNDTVNGEAGNDDEVAGGTGNDVVNGGEGDDYMRGGPDSDTMNGGPGNDYMNGACDIGCDSNVGTDDDTMNGGDGTDYMDGEDGNDIINGDAGDDATYCLFLCKFSNGPQRRAPRHMSATGADLCCFGAEGGLYGGDGNDVINGGDGNDYADGEDGNDTVNGNGGDDVYIDGFGVIYGGVGGGSGDDTVDGGDGIDASWGDDGNDTVSGGAGDDAFHIRSATCPTASAQPDGCGSEYIYGGVWGDSENDTLDGGDGRDFVDGGDGNDIVNGGPGDDTWHNYNDGYGADSYGEAPGLYGGSGDDTLAGNDGSDYLYADIGADNSDGGNGDDVIDERDDGSPDVVHGGAGIDDLQYWSCCTGNPVTITLDDQGDDGEAAQPDTADGDPGNNFGSDLDNVEFSTNCNTMCSNGGTTNAAATIVGTSGANLLYGAAGNDDITGGAGADYMSGAQGDDTFHARDGYPDYIDCDAGVDTAIVDQFDTVHNCENVDSANVASAFDTSKPPVPPVPPNPPANQAAQDNTPPQLTLTVPKTTFTADQLVAGVKVSFSCNEDCALSLRLLAQQSSGSATFSRVKGYNVVVGRRSVGFGKTKRNIKVRPCERKQGGPQSKACLKRFKKALNARLKKTGKVTMKLRAVTTDRAGNHATKIKTITIRKRV